MGWDEGWTNMRKFAPISCLNKRGLSKILLLFIKLIFIQHINLVSSLGVVSSPTTYSTDKQIVIAVPKRDVEGHQHTDKFSFSRTMAELGTRIKKKIGNAHKTFFYSDSVKRVGQPGKNKHGKPWMTQNDLKSSEPSLKFRPHQPDITGQMREGNLNLPVVEIGQDRTSELGLAQPKPTPMANKLNPYTNGIANSFPPGIDPYEGFIKYASENLDTPMGNIIDYHSLEHYYGAQHPLSPYHKSKEPKNNNGYADNFSYLGNNDGETSNSPPPPPPPPPPAHRNPSHGFRSHPTQNSVGNANPYNVNQEHGVDLYHAPSPGERRKPHNPGYPEFEEEYGRRVPPNAHSSDPSYPNKERGPPSRPPNELHDDAENNVPPPDLSVYEEGPPPELLNSKPVASPPVSDGSNEPFPNQRFQNDQSQNLDGGDDAIWGILDLAYMLEKGQLPGDENPKSSNSVSGSPAQTKRVVMPIFTRAPPPRLQLLEGGPYSASPNKYEYDDGSDLPDMGDSQDEKRPSHFPMGQLESQESLNDDYSDGSF